MGGAHGQPGPLRPWHGAAGLFAADGWTFYLSSQMADETPGCIFAGIPIRVDDTLPPEHVKMLGAGRAVVFRINDDESVEKVAEWDEAPAA